MTSPPLDGPPDPPQSTSRPYRHLLLTSRPSADQPVPSARHVHRVATMARFRQFDDGHDAQGFPIGG
jgi:hypothetical protein